MDQTLRAVLVDWTDFYLITGTAAAALTGLQFVVQTLIASEALRHVAGSDPEAGTSAFGTPTVVHFTMALLISALLCAPWPGYTSLRTAIAALGALSLVYAAVVLRRTLRQSVYVPGLEDWTWHVALPAAAYAAVLAGALLLRPQGAGPLFAVAGATLLLLCIGIHNAWDTVTYLTFSAVRRAQKSGSPSTPPPPPPRPAVRGPGGRRRRR